MKKIVCLTMWCALTGCTESDNSFYYDNNCDGVPKLVIRFIVDTNRQTVLHQAATINGNEIKEDRASYYDDCKVTDSKNFVCKDKSFQYEVTMSTGTLIWSSQGKRWIDDDCIYKKSFWGYKKIADATVKDTKSPPSQNK